MGAEILSSPRLAFDLAGAQRSDQPFETWTLDGAARRAAKIVIDHFNVGKPASTCDLDHSYWRLWLSKFD